MLSLKVVRFLRDEDGPTAVEYAMLLALILVALISSITAVGNSTSGMWADNSNRITSAMSNAS